MDEINRLLLNSAREDLFSFCTFRENLVRGFWTDDHQFTHGDSSCAENVQHCLNGNWVELESEEVFSIYPNKLLTIPEQFCTLREYKRIEIFPPTVLVFSD